LPLGFFVGFFGMNNKDSTGDAWMTMHEQIAYMFSLSTLFVLIAVCLAFSQWSRSLLEHLCYRPLLKVAKYLGLNESWVKYVAKPLGLQQGKYPHLDKLARKWRKDVAASEDKKEEHRQHATGDEQEGDEDSSIQLKPWKGARGRARRGRQENGTASQV
jgi:hypothetical protein